MSEQRDKLYPSPGNPHPDLQPPQSSRILEPGFAQKIRAILSGVSQSEAPPTQESLKFIQSDPERVKNLSALWDEYLLMTLSEKATFARNISSSRLMDILSTDAPLRLFQTFAPKIRGELSATFRTSHVAHRSLLDDIRLAIALEEFQSARGRIDRLQREIHKHPSMGGYLSMFKGDTANNPRDQKFHWEEAIQNPQSPVTNDEIYYKLSQLYARMGDRDKSMAYNGKAIIHCHSEHDTEFYRAVQMVIGGVSERAISSLHLLATIGHKDATQLLLEILIQQERFKEAKQILAIAREQKHDDIYLKFSGQVK